MTGNERTLSVYKRKPNDNSTYVCLHETSIDALEDIPESANENDNDALMMESLDHEDHFILSVPPPSAATRKLRQDLPVGLFRQEIVDKINNNQVLLISGATGIQCIVQTIEIETINCSNHYQVPVKQHKYRNLY